MDYRPDPQNPRPSTTLHRVEPDIYRLLGGLRVVADRLPQVYDQVTTALQRLGERRDWRADNGTTKHPDEVVATAIEGLQVAGCVAEDLGWNLQQAHCAVAHLYQ
jgi:hypothetical protein